MSKPTLPEQGTWRGFPFRTWSDRSTVYLSLEAPIPTDNQRFRKDLLNFMAEHDLGGRARAVFFVGTRPDLAENPYEPF